MQIAITSLPSMSQNTKKYIYIYIYIYKYIYIYIIYKIMLSAKAYGGTNQTGPG